MEETLERSAKEVDEAPAPLDEWEWAQLLAWVESEGSPQPTIAAQKDDQQGYRSNPRSQPTAVRHKSSHKVLGNWERTGEKQQTIKGGNND